MFSLPCSTLRPLCGSRPLVTPYYCSLGDLLCFVFKSDYCMISLCTIYIPSVLWLGLLTCKNRLPYNLYCVGGDVKHCSIQSIPHSVSLCRVETAATPHTVVWMSVNSQHNKHSSGQPGFSFGRTQRHTPSLPSLPLSSPLLHFPLSLLLCPANHSLPALPLT